MRRIVVGSLLFVFVGLLLAALGLWGWQTFRTEPPPSTERIVNLPTVKVGGITFETEHEALTGDYTTFSGEDTIGIRRADQLLDYEEGVLVVNGVGYPSIKAGDTVRWNLDGKVLINGVVAEPHRYQPRTIELGGTSLNWEPKRGRAQALRDTLSVAWARDVRLFAAASGDGGVRVWDPDKPAILVEVAHEPPKEGGFGSWGVWCDLSPSGKLLATANQYGPDLILHEVATGKALAKLSLPPGKTRAVHFLNEEWLLEARGAGLVARNLGGDRTRVVELGKIHQQFAPPYAISADGSTLVRNDGLNGMVARIEIGRDTITTKPISTIEKLREDSRLAVSPDGAIVAVFDGSNRLTLHTASTGAVKQRLRWRQTVGVAMQISVMTFFPDGQTLAVGDLDSIRLYDVGTGRERGWIAVPGGVRALVFSGDGKTLAAGLRYVPGVKFWETAQLQNGK